MKFIFVLVLLAFTIINPVNASVTGEWIGWGTWRFQGSGPECSIYMRFEDTTDKFAIYPGWFDCGILTIDIPTKIMTKAADGNLVYAGEVVGKWSENSVSYSERYNERTVINVSISGTETSLDYKEQWIEDEKKLLYDVDGRIFKRQDIHAK